MNSLTKITCIEEKKNARERRNKNSQKCAFNMREFVGFVGLTYFLVAWSST
jgi:hypothetical protein